MSAEIYGSVNGVTRKASKLYANVNGVTREIKEMYANINGVTRKIYQAMPKLIDTKYIVQGLTVDPTVSIIGGNYQVTSTNSRVDDYAWIYPIFDKSFIVTRITLYGLSDIPESSEHDAEYYVYFDSGNNTVVSSALYADKRSFSGTKDGLNIFWNVGSTANHFGVTFNDNSFLNNRHVVMWAIVTTKEYGTFDIPL
jgi:hypothetical protein